jgi:CO/xanthine dehydrogenase Mo-binding subunit
LPPVPAAIGNALASLDVHVTELPITAERVLDAIDSRAAGSRSAEAAP